MKLSFAIAVFVALAAFGMVASTAEAGDPGTIGIESATATVGERIEVELAAERIPAPGLGAWTVDIQYDPSVVRAIDCTAHQNGVCNPQYANDRLRVTGASATGLDGHVSLATVVFQCGQRDGISELLLSQKYFTIAGLGPAKPALENGAITCVALPTPAPSATATPAPVSLPPTGAGPSNGGSAWKWGIAILSATGASLVGIWALRRGRV